MKRLWMVLLVCVPLLSWGQEAIYEAKVAPDQLTAAPKHRGAGFLPILAYRGVSENFAELGLGYAWIKRNVKGIELTTSSNLEFDNQLMGFTLGYFAGFAIFERGLAAMAYTDFEQYSYYLKPNVGLGIGGIVTFGYGYNFPVTENYFESRINDHEFRFVLRLF